MKKQKFKKVVEWEESGFIEGIIITIVGFILLIILKTYFRNNVPNIIIIITSVYQFYLILMFYKFLPKRRKVYWEEI